ncbi:unnamed protein product [Caenorhabditis bovis]|uniref:1-phosphatidylinositol-3-phosphate 5-kinase n=1 Tax=Caenorhabditis bovis TaxID=2654633 RepID=A0A8S1EKH7_9PELO|nr:unnamed protein product [Caenorhabditis bovis]
MMSLNMSAECNNNTIRNGQCYNLAVCGYCYDFAEVKTVSKEYETFNLIVIGVLLPTVGCLGLIGNALSAFTYSRREMISSLNVYLFSLACSDIIIILTAFFLFFLENMRKRSVWATYYFAVLSPVMFPVGLTAQTLSVFITVASAFDCFVLVTAGEKFKSIFCSVFTSIVILCLIVITAFLYNAPHMFEIYVIDCWSLVYNTASKDVCPTALRANPDYLKIYYAYMYTIVMAVGPVVFLIVLNSAIVLSMRKSNSSNCESDIITLVLVVCLFITCNILPLTVNFLELLFGIINGYLIDLSNLMVVVNSSCNFLIYYAFGSHFRRTLQHYLRNVWRRKKIPLLENEIRDRASPRGTLCVPPTECCRQQMKTELPYQQETPCLSYDSKIMAATLDEAMFSFPNLATPQQNTLFSSAHEDNDEGDSPEEPMLAQRTSEGSCGSNGQRKKRDNAKPPNFLKENMMKKAKAKNDWQNAPNNTTNSAKNAPILGVVTNIGCEYRRGNALDPDSNWCGLCNLCWQWRKLPLGYYPNYLNEVNCDHNDDGCLSGFGECRPIYRSLNIMKKVDDDWKQVSIDTVTACECQNMEEENGDIHFFEQIDKPPEEDESAVNSSGYFSSFIGHIFRSDGVSQTAEVEATSSNKNDKLERKESQESKSSEEGVFQRSLTDKFAGLLKAKGGNLKLKNYNDSNFKQYWMPDSTGRECYQCEERFTTFRRRHHCRLCGQIFCSKCCNNRIDGASLGYFGELRLCDFCARKVERFSKDSEAENAKKPSIQRKISGEQANSQSTNPDAVRTISNGNIWSLCPPETARNSETRETPPPPSRRNSLVQTGVPTILSVQDLCAGPSTVTRNHTTHLSSVISEEEESGPDWFRSMNPGMDGILNNETSDSVDVFSYANIAAGAITTGFSNMTDERDHECNDRKITFPALLMEESMLNAAKEEQRDNLVELFDRNTERMLDEVLKRETISETKWRHIILKTAREVVAHVVLNVPMGDSMNITDYVHIKKLNVDVNEPDVEIVWGTVCTKSLIHQELLEPSEPSKESIMIVGGSIEYERITGKLSSIEPIIVQEEKFLEKQIERIAAKRASLILVEGGVSRLAAIQMQRKGIKVAVNVKLSALQRISRSTGADIVSNSDAQLIEQNLGFCPEFQQKNVTLKNGKTKMLMEFGDCRKEAGCTILIRSGDEKEMIAVKRTLIFLITVMYSNRLEQAYLNAFNVSIARRQSDCIVCERKRSIIYSTQDKTEFERALDMSMLSSSPVIEFEPPFLETKPGKSCPLISYFKQPLYKLLSDDDVSLTDSEEQAIPYVPKRPLKLDNLHGFCVNKRGAALPIMLKSFRTFAGISFRRRTKALIEHSRKEVKEKIIFRARDVLDPRVHQTLAVLFGSFSPKSPNAPYFCVRPWVVSMKYYNDHDMTVGEFLTKYCFNRNYECPSSNCEVPMQDHFRKLVYGRVCVEISTQSVSDAENELDSEQQKSIMAWKNCAKCSCSSQMVMFDHDIWHLSFAKFLDYLGNSCFTTDTTYPISSQNQCEHCFFHEKLYFFAMENLVTTFKVNAIRPYSVLFSPIICNVKVQKVSKKELGEDIKRIANLALGICEDTNKQLAELDEEVQTTAVVCRLSSAIRNTIGLAGESREFAKRLLNEEEELVLSNDRLFREATDTFMKIREMTYSLVMLWNDNCIIIRKRVNDEIIESSLQRIENPFPSHLHLSIKLQPKIGVVVRDIQDSRGNFKPDIGSIIAYALSAADYNKVRDDVSVDESISSANDGENISSTQHLEVEFEDETASYYVKAFYAEKFRKLREFLITEGEETFIRSLSNSTFWTPQGGKSGSFFYRTQDDRFVVKQMSRFEIQSFVKFAPNYFDYLTTAATENKLTTLCKVYGVFRIGYKSKTTTLKVDILVMEYLFYNHNVSKVWDLKGSLRNRFASAGKSSAEMVLLDENFVKDLWNQQLYVLPHSKAALNQAISNDSHFLSSQYIMDYSLLVGVDEDNGELILGIVDYMRTYTLDKKLESWVKIVAIPGAHLPTILSPEMYCARFSEAIDSYFPVVPDQWTGLGSVRSY